MAGSINYTKLLEKLDPTPGGEDTARMRTGIVDAVNSDGTVDLAISGIVVPDVPRVEGSVVAVNTVVQVISYRGSLLILGSTAGDNDWDAGRVIFYTSNETDGSMGGSNVETALLTSGTDLVAGVPYRVWFGIYTAPSVASSGHMRIREGNGTGGTMLREVFAQFPNATGATAANYFLLSARYVPVASGAQLFTVTAQGTSPAATMRREGASNRPNELWIERWL
jgi:hypothetical protein